MNAKIRRLTWIVCGSLVLGAGALGAAACGTDNGTTPLPGDGVDASSGNTKDGAGGGGMTDGTNGGGMTDGTPGGDTDGGTDAGTCKIATLHEAGPGPFCPFQDGGPDGSLSFGNCGAQQSCCYYQGTPPSPDSVCVNGTQSACGAAPANYTLVPWECDTKVHCQGANPVCCMYTSASELDAGKQVQVVPDTTCNLNPNPALKGKYVGGTRCETGGSCANGEIKVCGDDSDCTGGTHCTGFSTNAKQLGQCI